MLPNPIRSGFNPVETRKTRVPVHTTLGLLFMGLLLGYVSFVGVDSMGRWCYSEHQFSLDSVEGKGKVVDVEKSHVRTGTRRVKSVTLITLVVESEHGVLRIGSVEPLPIGAIVHYDYSPSQQTARFHGEGSMFWVALSGVILSVALGVFAILTLVVAFPCRMGGPATIADGTK